MNSYLPEARVSEKEDSEEGWGLIGRRTPIINPTRKKGKMIRYGR